MYNCKSRYVRIGNLQMLLEIVLLKKTKRKTKTKHKKRKERKKKKYKKRNQNCIKSGLSQFLLLQQKMSYVALMAIFSFS